MGKKNYKCNKRELVNCEDNRIEKCADKFTAPSELIEAWKR